MFVSPKASEEFVAVSKFTDAPKADAPLVLVPTPL